MDELLPRPPNSSPLTPLGFLDRAAVVYGDCPSLVYGDISYTWLETRDRCLKLASSISRLGLGRRDVVSVIAPNIPAMYELHFAIPMAGAVLHSINTRLDARTVSVILGHSESKLVFVDYQSISVISEAISLLPPNSKVPLLVLIGGEEKEESAASLDFHCTFEDMMIRDAKKGEVKEEEIIEFCRSKLAHYMVPKTVVFLEELPKTATGKIQKFVLREMAKKLGSADIRSRM
uniref:4-coumarate--CoA ligase n=1 Tax=Daucus carota subsp. sativus TaxID=79200 RepID=A0A166BU09_DAUCS